MTDDDFDWQRRTGATPSIQTGPTYDHTKGYSGGGTCDAWIVIITDNAPAIENKDQLGGCSTNFYFITRWVPCLRPILQCAGEIWKPRFHSKDTSDVFDSTHTTPERFERQSPAILHLCRKKTRTGNHIIIVTSSFGTRPGFQNVFRSHENANPVLSNSSSLKSV